MTRPTKAEDVTRPLKDDFCNTPGKPPGGKAPKGTPIETYKGDPDGVRIEDEGDLEEETLDRNAPFNKTYGIQDESAP